MLKEKLQEKYKNLFEPQIIYRGRDYFENGKVKSVYKDEGKEQYMSEVNGSNYNSYKVQILLDDENDPKFSCTCPCLGTCKHEYATLMAIDEKEYSTIKLLPIPDEKKINIRDFINMIPENKLKEYIVNSFEYDNEIDEEDLKEHFSCYLPEKSREYIYNTLFNEFQLGLPEITTFLNLAKSSLENGKYEYTFTISSCIIDAGKESGYCDCNEILLDQYSKIGMFIRISYRKGNEELKRNIEAWIKKYEEKNYYNDIYLEDMILQIK